MTSRNPPSQAPTAASERKAYVGKHPKCGGIIYAAVDDQRYAKVTAKDVANLIRQGFTIEHVGVEAVRQGAWCKCKKPIPAKEVA